MAATLALASAEDHRVAGRSMLGFGWEAW
jgi:hypothetical protein